MILFKTDKNIEVTDTEFCDSLSRFNLSGKSVLLNSRLFSFGRLQGKEAIYRIIEILQACIGIEGSLSIPCHTFSGYKNEIFDIEKSKCIVGVLGEIGRNLPGFIRTSHPIYSYIIWGNYGQLLNRQDRTTCFGENSFYDLFSKSQNPYILMLGTNLNVITNVHYYEQKHSAKSRFIKMFRAKIRENGIVRDLEFDSCVRDYSIYIDKVECFAKFDALLSDLNIIDRVEFSGDWIQGLQENDLEKAYYLCLRDNPEFYFFDSQDMFNEYYERNKFDVSHGIPHSEILKNNIIREITPQHDSK